MTCNKYAHQTFCHKCKKTVLYEYTKDGVISWMGTFGTLVEKKVYPLSTQILHPENPGASQYCRRCAYPMVRVRRSTMYQCSRHDATVEPCPYARNGHFPPGEYQRQATKQKDNNHKKKLWLDHNTVITPENGKISGATINEIGKMKGMTYMSILENAPDYVNWATGIAGPNSKASVELKHIASFFVAAQECQLLCSEPASGSQLASGSTTQPRGANSFRGFKATAKAAAKAKAKAAAEQFNLDSEEEVFW